MAAEYYLYPEGRTQDNYFRLDDGLGQNEQLRIFLTGDVHLSQVVIQTGSSSQLDLLIQYPSGADFTIKSFTTSATDFILNDASHYPFWSQLARGSRILIEKSDTGSTGVLEVGITTRSIPAHAHEE